MMAAPLRYPQLASGAAALWILLTAMQCGLCEAFTSSVPSSPSVGFYSRHASTPTQYYITHISVLPRPINLATSTTATALYAKKKGNTPRANPNYSNKKSSQPQQEKASVKEARFDAATRQFMFTLVGLTKTLPDKSKDILKNIHLSFYPGAKIGVVGLNGSGKVCFVF
jgi:ABC-type multidrug transport system fused ATPase/permease subunit